MRNHARTTPIDIERDAAADLGGWRIVISGNQGTDIVLEHPAGAPAIFILSMLLISKGFAPHSIFDTDNIRGLDAVM
jgi:hypothetical protein